MHRRTFLIHAGTLALIAGPARADGLFDDLSDTIEGAADSADDIVSGSGSSGGDLGTGEIDAGLRQALEVATERTVDRVGVADGFNADPKIHIPLPGGLERVQEALAAVGMGDMADELELTLNRAAEDASRKATPIFVDAISQMTLDDARAILNGPDDAATQYFRKTTSKPLKAEMRPVVDASLSQVGAVRAYDDMMGEYEQIPFVPDAKADLTDYGLEKTLDGLFYYLAREEAAIRNDPVARSTELLQRVFG